MSENPEVRVFGSILRNRVQQAFDDVRTLTVRESAVEGEDWIRDLWTQVRPMFPDDEIPMDMNSDERRIRIVRLESERLGGVPVLYRRMAKNAASRVTRNATYNKGHVLYGCNVTIEKAADQFGYVDVYVQAPGVDS